MEFDNNYFEAEVREGFYVTSDIKHAWAAQLEVLSDVDKACRENGIQYFAEWGTLLGAIRHHGFIPWDDDMDICMRRPDYNRFLKAAKDIMPEGYEIFDMNTDADNDNVIARIINGRNINCDGIHLEKYHGFPYVAGIDIFPLDYIAADEEDDKFQCDLIDIVWTVEKLARNIENKCNEINLEKAPAELEFRLRQVEELCGVTIDRNKSIAQQLLRLVDKLSGLYTENEADYITLMHVWLGNKSYKFPKNYYREEIRVPFENTDIPVPAEYEAILKIKYGDYMVPVHNWNSHEYPFFVTQKEHYKADGVEFNNYRDTYSDYMQYKEQVDVIRKAKKIVKSFNGDTHKTVLFLAYKSDNWNMLDNIYKQYCGEENTRVIVQSVPYYYKTVNGVFEKYADSGSYPDYVTITPIEEYNYLEEYPDEIVFQYPYDNYNSAGTTDSVFHSYNLALHTLRLTYIPYFRTDEIDENDMRAYTNMNEYVTMPGVVYSDRVIVQSEGIRKLYIKKLTEFFGEETESEWAAKIEAGDIGGN